MRDITGYNDAFDDGGLADYKDCQGFGCGRVTMRSSTPTTSACPSSSSWWTSSMT